MGNKDARGGCARQWIMGFTEAKIPKLTMFLDRFLKGASGDSFEWTFLLHFAWKVTPIALWMGAQ